MWYLQNTLPVRENKWQASVSNGSLTRTRQTPPLQLEVVHIWLTKIYNQTTQNMPQTNNKKNTNLDFINPQAKRLIWQVVLKPQVSDTTWKWSVHYLKGGRDCLLFRDDPFIYPVLLYYFLILGKKQNHYSSKTLNYLWLSTREKWPYSLVVRHTPRLNRGQHWDLRAMLQFFESGREHGISCWHDTLWSKTLLACLTEKTVTTKTHTHPEKNKRYHLLIKFCLNPYLLF